MSEGNSPGVVLAPARPRVSLRCGPWQDHEACVSEFCECPHHGKLPLVVPRPREGGDGER
jgi:hypothetical protein